ncbi:uncharacterized protein LOC135495676 isoform X2 [Lineus longissimus]|uniref:uncharacterized protein LOC135495676 isoform X2 n=1 Tax=Lineus longissimus TaxID=88925 RepID=UPI002B4C5700
MLDLMTTRFFEDISKTEEQTPRHQTHPGRSNQHVHEEQGRDLHIRQSNRQCHCSESRQHHIKTKDIKNRQQHCCGPTTYHIETPWKIRKQTHTERTVNIGGVLLPNSARRINKRTPAISLTRIVYKICISLTYQRAEGYKLYIG